MDISDLITKERIALDVRARDKPLLLLELARRAAAAGLHATPAAIATALQARERLGSTGLGKGFALPHARVEGLKDFFGLFVRLARPIDFEAIDGQQVDVVFLLLMPQDPGGQHVAALAAVARRIRDGDILQRLRRAADADSVLMMLTGG